jgi:hypothetical protein
MIVQRSPEMLEFAAGPEPTATMSQSVEPKSGATTTADELSRDYAARFSAPPAARSPGPDVAAGRDTARGDAGPKAREDRETTPGRTDTSPSEPTRPPLSQEQFQHVLPTRRQQLADEQAVGAAPSARQRVMTAPPAGIAARPAPAAPSTAAPPPPASAAASAAPPTGARGEAPQATSGTERSAELRKKAEALAENTERDRIQALSARVAPESVELRMTVTDRLSVRRDIDTLVTRLGGTLLPRRADTGSVELVVPRESYPALTRELARLGALAIVRQPTELPGSVRVTVSLTE